MKAVEILMLAFVAFFVYCAIGLAGVMQGSNDDLTNSFKSLVGMTMTARAERVGAPLVSEVAN